VKRALRHQSFIARQMKERGASKLAIRVMMNHLGVYPQPKPTARKAKKVRA
jgi:hypothetical protein